MNYFGQHTPDDIYWVLIKCSDAKKWVPVSGQECSIVNLGFDIFTL